MSANKNVGLVVPMSIDVTPSVGSPHDMPLDEYIQRRFQAVPYLVPNNMLGRPLMSEIVIESIEIYMAARLIDKRPPTLCACRNGSDKFMVWIGKEQVERGAAEVLLGHYSESEIVWINMGDEG